MSQENVEVVRRMLEALNRGDVEGAIEIADTPPEFEFVPSGVLIPDLASVQRGPEAFAIEPVCATVRVYGRSGKRGSWP